MSERLSADIGGVTRIVWDGALAHQPGRRRRDDEIAFRWGPGKACDAVVIYDTRAWLALDFVLTNPTLKTKVWGDFGDLVTDIRKAALKKLRQIDETLIRALPVEDAPKMILPLVVIGGQFPLNPLIYGALSKELVSLNLEVIGRDPRCCPPALMESHEFSRLLWAAQDLRVPAFRLMERWTQSDNADIPFAAWLHENHRRAGNRLDDEWLRVSGGWLFGRPLVVPTLPATNTTTVIVSLV